jgi:hypothetical protein
MITYLQYCLIITFHILTDYMIYKSNSYVTFQNGNFSSQFIILHCINSCCTTGLFKITNICVFRTEISRRVPAFPCWQTGILKLWVWCINSLWWSTSSWIVTDDNAMLWWFTIHFLQTLTFISLSSYTHIVLSSYPLIVIYFSLSLCLLDFDHLPHFDSNVKIPKLRSFPLIVILFSITMFCEDSKQFMRQQECDGTEWNRFD